MRSDPAPILKNMDWIHFFRFICKICARSRSSIRTKYGRDVELSHDQLKGRKTFFAPGISMISKLN